MRYPPTQREKTRARILNAAADLFRARGIAATGVDRVMARAGLTAGGFYAHFASKDRLVREAIDAAAERSRVRWYGRFDHLSGRAWVKALVESYLSEAHRDDRGGGCILPSLGVEVAREGASARRRFERRLRGLFALVDGRTQAELGPERAEIVAAVALCVGGVVLARAVPSAALSREILASARTIASELLGNEPRLRPRRRPRKRKVERRR